MLIKQLFTAAECEKILENIGRTTNVVTNDVTPGKGITVHALFKQKVKRHFSLLESDDDLWVKRITENITQDVVCRTGTHLVEYFEGSFVQPHTDNVTKPDRRVSAVTLVSSTDFEGGHFYLEGKHIPLEQGDTVIFTSDKLHAVTEVTKGRRVSTVNWWY